MKDTSSVKDFLIEGKLSEALAELMKISDDKEINQEAMLISSRLSALDAKRRTGQITHEDEDITRNQISAGILGLLHLIEHPNLLRRKRTREKGKRILQIAAVLLLLGLLSWRPVQEQLFYTFLESSDEPEPVSIFESEGKPVINSFPENIAAKASSVRKPLLRITKPRDEEGQPLGEISNSQLTFSVSSQEDGQELIGLYIEVIRMHACSNEGPYGQEGMLVNLGIPMYQYELIIVPEITRYRLLPPTVNNVEDSWRFDKGDISKFVVNFSSFGVQSTDLVVKAIFLDHSTKTEQKLESEIYRYENWCEGRAIFKSKALQDEKSCYTPLGYQR